MPLDSSYDNHFSFISLIITVLFTNIQPNIPLHQPTNKIHSSINQPIIRCHNVQIISTQPTILLVSIYYSITATWCGPCIRVIPHLDEIQKANPNVKILQISREPKTKISQTYGDKQVSFAVSSVTEELWSSLTDAIGLRGIPHALVIENGIVVFQGHPATQEFGAAVAALNKKIEDKLIAVEASQ